MADTPEQDAVALTAKLVAAFLRGNELPTAELPELIMSTHLALTGAVAPKPVEVEARAPAVSIKKSVTADAIICLECGQHKLMLKRHLRTAHNLDVEEYRAKWSLPADYPMTAPGYAQTRSDLAKKFGLGQHRGAAEPEGGSDARAQADHQYPPSRWSRPSS